MSASSSRSRLNAQPRRKACDACANAKVRCDKSVACARCRARGLRCSYPGDAKEPQLQAATQGNVRSDNGHRTAVFWSRSSENGSSSNSHEQSTPLTMDALPGYPHDPTILPEDTAAIAIQTRWLKPFLVDDSEPRKFFSSSTTRYLREVLKSYVLMVANDCRLPPFIHSSQVSHGSIHLSLSKCLGLLRVLSVQAPSNEAYASELFEREMTSIMESCTLYDTGSLLGAFQAYLLYTMALYFSCGLSGLRENVVNLQQLASMLCSQDSATASTPWDTPTWSLWTQAEAKRRTTFTMYLFDNLLCAVDDLPIYVGTELSAFPAPAPKSLWEAATLDDWKRAHNVYLSATDGVPLQIHELWPLPLELSNNDAGCRQGRVNTWLQRVDEYGMMMFAITTSSHA